MEGTKSCLSFHLIMMAMGRVVVVMVGGEDSSQSAAFLGVFGKRNLPNAH